MAGAVPNGQRPFHRGLIENHYPVGGLRSADILKAAILLSGQPTGSFNGFMNPAGKNPERTTLSQIASLPARPIRMHGALVVHNHLKGGDKVVAAE